MPVDPNGPSNSDWEVEESLDIEWAHAMAPMANIILFEASSNIDGAVSNAQITSGVDVISMSWSESESGAETGSDPLSFTTPAGHGGITYLAASGDYGAYVQNSTMITPQYPAASPDVVAVGGTSLTAIGNTYSSETSWGNGASSDTAGGGGGGVSQFESQPSYQSGVTNAFSTSNRCYPDVSADANPGDGVPVYDSYDFGVSTPWYAGCVGGTSLATPLWAGMIAVADQGRAISGLGSLDGQTQTLPLLYQIQSAAPGDFHNITTGNSIGPTSPTFANSTPSSPSYYPGTGFNLATGIGSPVANELDSRPGGLPRRGHARVGLARRRQRHDDQSFRARLGHGGQRGTIEPQLHLGRDRAARRRHGADLLGQRHECRQEHHGHVLPCRKLYVPGHDRGLGRTDDNQQRQHDGEPDALRDHGHAGHAHAEQRCHAAVRGRRLRPVWGGDGPWRHGLVGQRGINQQQRPIYCPLRLGFGHGHGLQRTVQRVGTGDGHQRPDHDRTQFRPDAGRAGRRRAGHGDGQRHGDQRAGRGQ